MPRDSAETDSKYRELIAQLKQKHNAANDVVAAKEQLLGAVLTVREKVEEDLENGRIPSPEGLYIAVFGRRWAVYGELPNWPECGGLWGVDTIAGMRDFVIVFVHLIVTMARLARPGVSPGLGLWLPQTRIPLQEKGLGHSLLMSAAIPCL
jgi:hypothetical protein